MGLPKQPASQGNAADLHAAEIRVDITKKELDNHIEQATVVDEVMSSKVFNE